jgi:hypothetical protein
MKYLFALLPVIFLTAFFSCKKEPNGNDNNNPKDSTVVIVEFKAKMNGENLVIKTGEYLNISGYKIKFETLRFYLSNLKLVKDDNSEVLLKDVSFLDFVNNHNNDADKGEQIIITTDAGSFKSVKFGVVVDPSLNNSDPSVYPETHPLSIYTGEHWSWNTGYIFFKLEGRYDTLGVNPNLAPIFLFHLGTNPLYLEKVLSKNITVVKEDTTRIKIILNAEKLFFSANDTIDLKTDHNTQSTDDFPLAERMKNNLGNSFSIE